jgi:hypothetical protein
MYLCYMIKHLLLVFTQFFCFAIFAQEKSYTLKQLDTDLAYMDSIFSKIHPHNFPNYNQKRLAEHRKQVRLQFSESNFSNFQYNLALRAAIDSFACVHTYIQKNPLRPKVESNFFDSKFFATNNKLYLYPTIKERMNFADSIVEIKSINGISSSTLLQKMLIHHSPDGHSEAFGFKCANLVGAYYIASILNRPDNYFLKVMTKSGQEQEIKIEGSNAATNQLFHRKEPFYSILNSKNYKFTYIQDSIGYLKISDFKGKYKAMYKRVFAYLEKDDCKNLIIDLRDNLGGTRSNGMELLSYLISKDVYYDVIRPNISYSKYLSSKGKQTLFFSRLYYNFGHLFHRKRIDNAVVFNISNKAKKDIFKGKITVLVDGFTSSTAVLVASLLKDNGAIIIGQQTGGGEAGNFGGTFQTMILPESKVEIHFPLLLLRYGVKSTNLSGIVPNIIVSNLPENQGVTDEELVKALEVIRR